MATGIWTNGLHIMDLSEMPANSCMDDDARDILWLKQIAACNEEALKELYVEYGRRLFSFALRLTGDADQAEDVVQDTLVTVWHDASRFRGQGRVIAWLLGIVHNTALKSLRHRSKQVSLDLAEVISSDAPGPEENLQKNERRDLLRLGLTHLSREHREVLDLVFFQRLTLEETARVIGCPLGTVKSRLSYARTQLRGDLERSGAGKENVR